MPEIPRRGRDSTAPAGTPRRQKRLVTRRLVEQPQQPHGGFVVDGRHQVGVANVVDPWDVLVADPFDAMSSEAGQEERGALEGLGGGDAGAGKALLEESPRQPACPRIRWRPPRRRNGPGGRRSVRKPDSTAGPVTPIVPEVVPELIELVEDHGLGPGPLGSPSTCRRSL